MDFVWYNIGQKIRQRLDEKEHSVVWLARQLACSRTNVYKIFEKAHIDTQMLARISVILEFDFFAVLSTELRKQDGIKASRG